MIRTTLRESALYIGASAFAFAADILVLSMLVQVMGMHYLAAAAIAFTTGAVVAYFLCVRLVFDFRRMNSSGVEFGMFWGIGTLGLLVNAAAMAIGIEVFHAHLLLAKTGSAAVTCAMNFTLRKLLLFTPTQAFPVAHTGSGDIRK